MFERYTREARRAIFFARYEAGRVAHPSSAGKQRPFVGAASLCALRKGCVARGQDQPPFPTRL